MTSKECTYGFKDHRSNTTTAHLNKYGLNIRIQQFNQEPKINIRVQWKLNIC